VRAVPAGVGDCDGLVGGAGHDAPGLEGLRKKVLAGVCGRDGAPASA
jgi:hypothetical protein